MKCRYVFTGLFTLFQLSSIALAETAKESETIINNVKQLHRESKFKEAEPQLKAAVSKNPKDQKLSIQYGYNLFSQERYNDAEKELKRTIGLSPNSWSGQQALFLLAKSQYRIGKNQEASATIEKMKNDHPDSGWLPDIWILEAEMKGENTADAKEKLQRQEAAQKVYYNIVQPKKQTTKYEKILALRKLAADNRGLPIELAARESEGNLLSTTSATQEAINIFHGIIHDLKDTAPKSRIVQTANSRLAGLYHWTGDKKAALGYYQEILDIDPTNSIAESARLKSSAIEFEFAQHDQIAGKVVPKEKWQQVRKLIVASKQNAESTETLIIADLMELESYHWEGVLYKVLESGANFESKYSEQSLRYRKELATAKVFMARAAKELKKYPEAIEHAKYVLNLYPDSNEIWKNMDHIQRTYFDLIESLEAVGSTEEADVKLEEFKGRYPSSPFIKALEFKSKQSKKNENYSAGDKQ